MKQCNRDTCIHTTTTTTTTLEGYIDDERQFKTAKGNYINKCILAPQAPGDATVLKRFFRDNFVR